jgi:hypothetical protein
MLQRQSAKADQRGEKADEEKRQSENREASAAFAHLDAAWCRPLE